MKFKKIPLGAFDKELQDEFAKIEQTNLTDEERLGLAYCRLNSWQWDDLFGPCPEGFYDLPYSSGKPGVLTRDVYTQRPKEQIRAELGIAKVSMYWWKFILGKSEEEWKRWYYTEWPAEYAKMTRIRERRERLKDVLSTVAMYACIGLACVILALLRLAA